MRKAHACEMCDPGVTYETFKKYLGYVTEKFTLALI